MKSDSITQPPTISYKHQVIIVILVAIILTVGVWLTFEKKIEDVDKSKGVEYINMNP